VSLLWVFLFVWFSESFEVLSNQPMIHSSVMGASIPFQQFGHMNKKKNKSLKLFDLVTVACEQKCFITF